MAGEQEQKPLAPLVPSYTFNYVCECVCNCGDIRMHVSTDWLIGKSRTADWIRNSFIRTHSIVVCVRLWFAFRRLRPLLLLRSTNWQMAIKKTLQIYTTSTMNNSTYRKIDVFIWTPRVFECECVFALSLFLFPSISSFYCAKVTQACEQINKWMIFQSNECVRCWWRRTKQTLNNNFLVGFAYNSNNDVPHTVNHVRDNEWPFLLLSR